MDPTTSASSPKVEDMDKSSLATITPLLPPPPPPPTSILPPPPPPSPSQSDEDEEDDDYNEDDYEDEEEEEEDDYDDEDEEEEDEEDDGFISESEESNKQKTKLFKKHKADVIHICCSCAYNSNGEEEEEEHEQNAALNKQEDMEQCDEAVIKREGDDKRNEATNKQEDEDCNNVSVKLENPESEKGNDVVETEIYPNRNPSLKEKSVRRRPTSSIRNNPLIRYNNVGNGNTNNDIKQSLNEMQTLLRKIEEKQDKQLEMQHEEQKQRGHSPIRFPQATPPEPQVAQPQKKNNNNKTPPMPVIQHYFVEQIENNCYALSNYNPNCVPYLVGQFNQTRAALECMYEVHISIPFPHLVHCTPILIQGSWTKFLTFFSYFQICIF